VHDLILTQNKKTMKNYNKMIAKIQVINYAITVLLSIGFLAYVLKTILMIINQY
jgi:hypothetical protein